MADIEDTELDVPLYRVVEHIVLHHLVASRRSARSAKVWDRALKELMATGRAGKLGVRGFRVGSKKSKTVPPMEFPEKADNPVAELTNSRFAMVWGEWGKRHLEFDVECQARILEGQSTGPPAVLWINVCANSGAEVLRLWPPKSAETTAVPPPKLQTSELDAVLSTVEHKAERKSASAAPTPAARQETSENDPAAFRSAPTDAPSTIDASYEGSEEVGLIHVKSEPKIREAIMQVYDRAQEQNVAIPNSRDMCRFVNIILARKRGRANVTLIEKLADEVRAKERCGRYERLFCGSGETAARKNLKRSNKLNV
jgi:hypothetical protein